MNEDRGKEEGRKEAFYYMTSKAHVPPLYSSMRVCVKGFFGN